MSDAIKTIREAIEGRIEALPNGFTKLDNKFNLEKNNFKNEDKRYGVIALSGNASDVTIIKHITIDRTFGITLCNKFKGQVNKDEQQEEISDLLENEMNTEILDLSASKLGLPNTVLNVNFSDNDAVEFEEVENLAILRFNIIVTFRQKLSAN